jgi:hypothetical protein
MMNTFIERLVSSGGTAGRGNPKSYELAASLATCRQTRNLFSCTRDARYPVTPSSVSSDNPPRNSRSAV